MLFAESFEVRIINIYCERDFSQFLNLLLIMFRFRYASSYYRLTVLVNSLAFLKAKRTNLIKGYRNCSCLSIRPSRDGLFQHIAEWNGERKWTCQENEDFSSLRVQEIYECDHLCLVIGKFLIVWAYNRFEMTFNWIHNYSIFTETLKNVKSCVFSSGDELTTSALSI